MGTFEEGVTSEASSLAVRQELGNLTVVYDRDGISISPAWARAIGHAAEQRETPHPEVGVAPGGGRPRRVARSSASHRV
ncbi:hypothetical protein [Pseudonocardia spinosispora]|uniref:hypothetical protein n=1 Tax=Pseudonocardia spinosispora TaxID=103441 RepID=UPI003CCC32D5